MARSADDTAVSLLDAGDERRLERFGRWVVDRPAPVAIGPRRDPGAWAAADLRFEAGRGWSRNDVEPWLVEVAGLAMELRPTSSGGLGLYPEHGENLDWLTARIAARAAGAPARQLAVLNLFAHTGLATLAMARAGAAVSHVDAASGSVAWARANAARNGLADRPIRWLVDDALAFVRREARRQRRYSGLVLDPPSFGHSPGGRGHGGRDARGQGGRAGRAPTRWRLEDDLPELLTAATAVLDDAPFVLLTAHTAGLASDRLVALVEDALSPILAARDREVGRSEALRPELVPLELTAESGARLPLGWAIRIDLADPHQPADRRR